MSEKFFKVKSGITTANIVFNNKTVNSNLQVSFLQSNVLAFSGTSGQLFSIADTMTGTIFAVNDISGVPSIEVYDTGDVRLAETFGNVLIGSATNPSNVKFYVNGAVGITGAIYANGSVGTSGQVLTSNANGVYWSTLANTNLVQANLTTLTTSVNTIKANVDSVAGNVTTLTTSVNTIKANVDSVAGNVTTLTTSVNTIKANVDLVQSNVANIINGNTAFTGTIRSNSAASTGSSTVAVYANTSGGFFRAYGPTFSVASLANKAAFGPDGANGIVIFSNASATSGSAGDISLRGGGYDSAAEKLLINKDGSYFTSGNVGIGTSTPAYKLQVNGSFAATTKSFVIDHPIKAGMKLRYGSLEGPENGVYVRGRTTSNVINLPDHWSGLVYEDSITVSLTPIGNTAMPSVVSYDNKRVTIQGNTINSFYHIFAERKDVDKLVVEF